MQLRPRKLDASEKATMRRYIGRSFHAMPAHRVYSNGLVVQTHGLVRRAKISPIGAADDPSRYFAVAVQGFLRRTPFDDVLFSVKGNRLVVIDPAE
jgi:hypothetical protein